MTGPVIHVEDRSAARRCAVCHGALDRASLHCDGCQTDCHADCRQQLGHCPTLGCPAGRPQGGAHPPRGHGHEGAGGPASGQGAAGHGAAAQGAPAHVSPARVDALVGDARAGLLVSIGAIAAGIAAFVFVCLVSGFFAPTPRNWTTTHYRHDSSATGGGYALGLLWGASAALALAGVLHLSRHLRALGAIRRLAARPPHPAVLQRPLLRGAPKLVGLPHQPGGRGRADLGLAWCMKPDWVYAHEELAVSVRVLEGGGPILVEAPGGEIALVFPS